MQRASDCWLHPESSAAAHISSVTCESLHTVCSTGLAATAAAASSCADWATCAQSRCPLFLHGSNRLWPCLLWHRQRCLTTCRCQHVSRNPSMSLRRDIATGNRPQWLLFELQPCAMKLANAGRCSQPGSTQSHKCSHDRLGVARMQGCAET
jgi:hypothetical protein